MDISSLLTIAIPTIAIAIVGVVLKNQIKSQDQLLKNYKDYIETTDWKKVAEVLTNQFADDKINTLKELLFEKKKHDERMKEEFEELMSVCVYCLKQLDKDHAKRIVETLKYHKSAMQDFLDGVP